ncbi:ImmA/IrrE family metallo-endopeptidase [Thomasclavelia spiroformis]|uniref:ImmA/IrrE family metallo-endopeptidase n=1 Tax=Thomasclavelia spiroformis TaxID=29348 RepID=UPI0032079436
MNTFLSEPVKRIVAAHEMGHIILHRHQLKMSPMKDSVLYDMTSQTEYEANMFAADLLINGEHIHTLSKEDMDYFSMCKYLYTTPYVMSFKLFSLIRRGYAYDLPMGIDSRFFGNKYIYLDSNKW